MDQLSDDWLVIPDVGMGDSHRDRQTDIVIAHHRDGVAVVEVKGHRVSIDQGVWKAHGSPMKPAASPRRRTTYSLRNRLRTTHPSLSRLRVAWAVALPNTSSITGRLPIEVDRRQVLTCDRSKACPRRHRRAHGLSVGATARAGGHRAAGDAAAARRAVRLGPRARARLARARLGAICAEHVSVLARLDLNRRCVSLAEPAAARRLAAEWVRQCPRSR
ncbi:MAG: nuclease-related domain-containing protein [Ilumatobacteraceae bacterium]